MRCNCPTLNSTQVQLVIDQYQVQNIIAESMVARDVVNSEVTQSLCSPDIAQLHDPVLMKGMVRAANRIIKNIQSGIPIFVFGDYDVDGTTSAAFLTLFFRSINVESHYYIPCREKEGYGISTQGIDYANYIGADIFISCDCGINAFEQIEYAAKMDIDVIVTDHHKPEKNIPECIAVINPNRKDCDYPFKGLCGAGVAFKLAFALAPSLSVDPDSIWQSSDLITI